MLRQRDLFQLRHAPAISAVLADYLALTKPVIISLLLVTALGGMFVAEQGVPSSELLAWVMLGGALGAGGANALNHYVERDTDKLMTRTRRRPVAAQRIGSVQALLFGLALNLLAFLVFFLQVNLISALLTAGASVFYVLVYTIWLKRTTTQNIVIGGAAGSIPPVVGWTAVTGQLDLPCLLPFRNHILLDALPFLGTGPSHPAGLRRGQHPHAACRQGRSGDYLEHTSLRPAADGVKPAVLHHPGGGLDLPLQRRSAMCSFVVVGLEAVEIEHDFRRSDHLFVLAGLPGRAVRSHDGGRRRLYLT